MGFAGARSTNEHGVALFGEEVTIREISDQRLVDRRAAEGEAVDILGQW